METHQRINETFIELVNADPELKAFRDFVEGNNDTPVKIFGFGERSFLWMWKLLVDEGALDMANFESCMAIIMAGDLGTNATIDAKLTQATTSGGTYKDVTGKAITQLTQAGTDDNKQAIILCRSDELDVANGYRYVKLSMTTAVATSDSAAALFGIDARYSPPTDATTVDEVV